MTDRRIAAVVAAALGLTVAMASCGVRGESKARLVDDRDVPFALDETTTPTTAPPTDPPTTVPTTVSASPLTTAPPSTVPQDVVSVYFVRGSDLVEVERAVPSPAGASSALRALLAGPPPEAAQPSDGQRGLRTALGDGIITGVNVAAGVADVDLRSGFVAGLLPNDVLRAFAQMTLTLTSLPGIGQVSYREGARPLTVLRADGSLAARVSRDDYESLIAPPAP